MRWFLVMCFMMSGLAAFGSEWGMWQDYESEIDVSSASTVQSAQSSLARPNNQLGQKFLLKDILAGRTIAIYLDRDFSSFAVPRNEIEGQDFSDQIPGAEQQEQLDQRALVQGLYDNWFSYAADTIRREHREKEFADILAILDRGVSIQWVDDLSKADIMFKITSLEEVERFCGGEDVLGCYAHASPSLIYLPFNTRKSYAKTKLGQAFNSIRVYTQEVGLHEVGHSLGLADQYDEAADVNSHAVYASSKQGTGIMNNVCHGKLFGKCRLTCDDVDGLINLIDVTRGITSERNEYGWRSLCRLSKDVYSYGKPASRSPISIEIKDMDNGVELVRYEGRYSSRQLFPWVSKGTISPFDLLSETAVQRDARGRVVQARGPQGEDIYYAYNYRGKIRLVTKGDKALLFERILPSYALGRGHTVRPMSHYFLFKKDSKKAMLEAYWSKYDGGKVAYLEGDSFSEEPSYSLVLQLDGRKRVINENVHQEIDSEASPAPLTDEPTNMAPQKRVDRLGRVMQKQAEDQQENALRQQMLQWFRTQYSK